MGLEGRDPEIYKFGLEEVDVHDLFEGFTHEQIRAIACNTQALMLSSFCRGNCPECGLDAKPYTPKNRKIFEVDSLISFLEEYDVGMVRSLMLYDASDPLDYPDLIKLLRYFERLEYPKRVSILTSCPPGTEKVFEELLEMERKGELANTTFSLSVLPSNRDRLMESGIFQKAAAAGDGWHGPVKFKHVNPRYIGRNRVQGCAEYLDTGFYCGDLMVITPMDGPCCAEYHAASERFPTERKLVPVRESGKVYFHDQFFSMNLGGGLGFESGTQIYTPESDYLDLDNPEGGYKKEVAQRHFAAFAFSILKNLSEMKTYSTAFDDNFAIIRKAVETGGFSLSRDLEDRAFYSNLIPTLMSQLMGQLCQMESFLGGKMFMGNLSFRPGEYRHLIEDMRKLVLENRVAVLGA